MIRMDQRIERMDQRIEQMDQRMEQMDQRMTEMDERLTREIRESEARTRLYIENTVTKKIDVLFDGYQQNFEKQRELEERTEQMQEQMRPEALKRIQSTLVLEEIAKKEDIQVSEEDIDNELDRMAGMYGMQADQLKEYMGDSEKESMKMEISIQKAVELIMECATEIDADPE